MLYVHESGLMNYKIGKNNLETAQTETQIFLLQLTLKNRERK